MRHDLAAAIAFLSLSVLPAAAQSTVRASVDASGNIGYGNCRAPWISADGRLVVFGSLADELADPDGNSAFDVFVYDRWTGATECASLDPVGVTGNGSSDPWAVSADGRYVVFASYATNLGPSDTNGLGDMYLRDRLLGVTEMVCVDSNEVQGNLASSIGAAISADGRYVAFGSFSNNLAPNDGNNTWDVFLRDRLLGLTSCISVTPGGATGNNQSQYCAMSADGRYVAFDSKANDLTADTTAFNDIFVRDLVAGTTTLVSRSTTGTQANADCTLPSISADGRFVTFTSLATTLVTGDTNGAKDVFVRDVLLSTTIRASLSETGVQFNLGSLYGAISPDGGYVAFVSRSAQVVANDTNNAYDVFLRDLAGAATSRLSLSSGGVESVGDSGTTTPPSIAAGGNVVVFDSVASNLVAGDVNGFADVFVRDRTSMCLPIASYCTAKVNSGGCAPFITSSGEPSVGGTDAFFVASGRMLPNKNGLFFWGTSAAALPFGGGTLCVKPPLKRTAVTNSGSGFAPGACDGAHTYHFSQAYMALKNIAAGAALYGQFWSRDPGFAPPDNVSLSDALQFVTCP